MKHRPVLAALVASMTLSSFAIAEEAEIQSETSLRSAPESAALSGLLTPGTPVEVLERSGAWVRVRLEGWVRAEAVGAAPAPAAAPPATPPPPAAPPKSVGMATRAGHTLEGAIQVKKGLLKKKVSPAGANVWVLPVDVDLHRDDREHESDERLAELEAEARRLKAEADRALSETSNFTEAAKLKDELMDERKTVLDQRRDLLAVRHGRHEQIARESALASSIADSKGWYSFSGLAPGTYALYARLAKNTVDLEWIETFDIDDASVRMDLDHTNVRGMLPRD